MKRILYVAGLLFFAAATTTTLCAQNLKFGHINSNELLQQLPETKTADSALQKYVHMLEDQIKAMNTEYQMKIEEYQRDAPKMIDAVKLAKEKEILDLQNRIRDFQDEAPDRIQKKKEELYSHILKKAEDAIKAVAKENNYSYIFDTAIGVVLFAQEGDDILALVKKKMGIAVSNAPKK
jgi:outer membrane protein